MGESRKTGKVKWFNGDKGFGFITPDEGSQDLFVHFTSIRAESGRFQSLDADEEVEFVVDSSGDRPVAVDVTVRKGNPVRANSTSGSGGDGGGNGGGGGKSGVDGGGQA